MRGEVHRRAWDASQDAYVELRTAAGVVFSQVYEGGRAEATSDDYERALDVIAAALSRLVTVYAGQSGAKPPVALTVDLTWQRFRNGATQLAGLNGVVLDDLLVARSSVFPAIPAIRRANLEFGIT